jgi:hypothetical protein
VQYHLRKVFQKLMNSCAPISGTGRPARARLARQKWPICRDIPRCAESRALLAMQKVVGSNPISRFREGLCLQVFFVGAVGWSGCIAGHPMGTRRLRTIPFAGIS